MFTLDENIEGVLMLERILFERRLDRALCDESSAGLDNDGTRGDSALDETSLVDPDASGTFKISRSLPVNNQFVGLDGIGELRTTLLFDDH